MHFGKKKVSFGLTTVISELKKRNKVGGMTEKRGEEEKANFAMDVLPVYKEGVVPGERVIYSENFGSRRKTFGGLQNAVDVMLLENGFVVTDFINNKLIVFSENGDVIDEIGSGDIKEPWTVARLGDDRLAVCCKRSKCVAVVNRSNGQLLQTFGQWFFKSPCGIAAVSDDRVVVTDDVTNKISVHDLGTGKIVGYLGESLSFKSPRYVTVASNGNIIISDTGNHSVKIFDCNGNFVKEFGKYGDGNGCFKFPHGVCVDQFDHIFVADHYNNRISVFDQDGRFSCHVIRGIHDLHHPQGLTMTPDLHLFVTSGDLKATNVLKYKLELISTEQFRQDSINFDIL